MDVGERQDDSKGRDDGKRLGMMNQTDSGAVGGILSFVPFLVISVTFGVVAFLLAREKGRNVQLWTILGVIPIVNFVCLWFFIGAANLRLERKIDQLLSQRGLGTARNDQS